MPSPCRPSRILGSAVTLVVMVLAAATPSPAAELDDLLTRFDRVQDSIRTLTAEFTETTQSVLLKDEIVAKGKVYLTKPAAVR